MPDRPTRLYVCDTEGWLFASLTEEQDLGGIDRLERSDAHHADVVLYPVPHSSKDAPDALRRLDRRLWPNVFVFSSVDLPVMWAPGVYTSPEPSGVGSASIRGGFYVVDYHRAGGMRLDVAPIEQADRLWSFVGVTRTHPATRVRIMQITDERSIVLDNTAWEAVNAGGWRGPEAAAAQQGMAVFEQSIRRSKFVVCPRGVGSSSKRLFEAMAMGRCPVIVSDDWLPPPFVDWPTCSIRVPEREIETIPTVLRAAEDRAPDLARAARRAWEQWFAPDRRLRFLVDAAADIAAHGGATPAARGMMMARAATSRALARQAKVRLAAGRSRRAA